MLINHKNLKRLIFELMIKCGSKTDEAITVADHLVQSNLNGHDSHGVVILKCYQEN